MAENGISNCDKNLKESFLAAYQTVEFTKENKKNTIVADILRRCLFTKYVNLKKDLGEDAAAAMLKHELVNYTDLIDNTKGLNNYWEQFEQLDVDTDNNPTEWKTHLSDPKLNLQFYQKLPCTDDEKLPCQKKPYMEKDVQKLMELWKNGGTSPRARKVSAKQESKSLLQNKNVQDGKQSKLNFSNLSNASSTFVKKDFEYVPCSKLQSKLEPESAKHHSRLQSHAKNQSKSEPNAYSKKPLNIERSYGTNSNFSNKSDGYTYDKLESGKQQFQARQEFHKRGVSEKKPPFSYKNEQKPVENKFGNFKTARTELSIQQAKNNNRDYSYRQSSTSNISNRQMPVKKSLGGKGVNSKFISPFRESPPTKEEEEEQIPTDERLKNVEPKMIELIKNEIMDSGPPIQWEDIAGLEHPKRIIKEIVVFPMLRPDIFTGLRRPPKGILLFGPPGTGKTLIGKCIASQSKSTFFSISASSLTSKWVGEGEKMVRALFAVARVEQPSVVFIDEIDSLLCQRSETEHESSRRMKTEFLVQLDGASTEDEDRILVIGATNRPYELDEAARRRLVKRLYVPLPELEARAQIVRNLLKSERHDLKEEDILQVANLAEGYSGADMTNLCKEASMGPIRSIPFDQLENINKEDVRKVTFDDFKEALNSIRPSVSQKDLAVYIDWDQTYGTASAIAK